MASLNGLPLSPAIVTKLNENDFNTTEDVADLKPADLAFATKLTMSESAEVIRLSTTKFDSILSQAVTLKNILESDEPEGSLTTFCENLDEILLGGFPLKAITEISGSPGVGKTQMCLQACLSVQVPTWMGGLGGEAVYIDTEGSFSILRFREMAEFLINHVNMNRENSSDDEEFTIAKVLSSLYYFRCRSYIEILAVVKNLFTFLPEHPNVRVVVIDSVAFHFRHSFTDMRQRTNLLCSLSQDLITLAAQNNLAVIVTNQMTTRIDAQGGGAQVVAALGETWGHCPTVRLLLHWAGIERCATVVKAPHVINDSACYKITPGGIRNASPVKEIQKKRKLSSDSNA